MFRFFHILLFLIGMARGDFQKGYEEEYSDVPGLHFYGRSQTVYNLYPDYPYRQPEEHRYKPSSNRQGNYQARTLEDEGYHSSYDRPTYRSYKTPTPQTNYQYLEPSSVYSYNSGTGRYGNSGHSLSSYNNYSPSNSYYSSNDGISSRRSTGSGETRYSSSSFSIPSSSPYSSNVGMTSRGPERPGYFATSDSNPAPSYSSSDEAATRQVSHAGDTFWSNSEENKPTYKRRVMREEQKKIYIAYVKHVIDSTTTPAPAA